MFRSIISIAALIASPAIAQTTSGDCSPVVNGSQSVTVNCGTNTTSVTAIAGRPYETARILLMEAGWQPSLGHPSLGSTEQRQAGNGPYLWQAGYHELVSCSGSSFAPCLLYFSNPDGEYLRVVTQGEAASENNLHGITVRGAQKVSLEEARADVNGGS